ncbi:MAG: DUF5667 domain-containing protein [Candidatus Pacebacteria bacterium]|nr:DUF5667 domain-containing protein [Candidatus Paceibacterota bacterium]
MNEKNLIEQLKEFKTIKPNNDWVNWLKANLLEIKFNNILERPKVRLVSFSFIKHRNFIPVLLGLFAIVSFSFAQVSLPGNILYPIKTLTQDTRIYLSSDQAKPMVRLEIAKSRMEDLSKIQNHEKEIKEMVKTINKDLELVPQEIKKINKKQVALDVSKNIQEKSKDLQGMADRIVLEENDKQELTKTVENTQSQVLALIIETTDEINQCPSFLSNNLIEISGYFADTDMKILMNQWSMSEVIKAKALLSEASESFKAGDCLTAMEKIESINQLLSILSLDVQVETSTSENLDEGSSIIPLTEESIEEKNY